MLPKLPACLLFTVCLITLPALAQQPAEPAGVEVQGRGPVHEAFAAPTQEPTATPLIARKPPAPIEELPPEARPEGDVVWIGGYWAFDDERNDFLWISGCWRALPPGRQWIPGYWREEARQWQWVPGFWATQNPNQPKNRELAYFPAPPAPPLQGEIGPPPDSDSFYVPGHWVWGDARFVWVAGYWARVQPGYVWVPAHYRWTPHGYLYIAGYWDHAVARRGILYAPVAVDWEVVPAGFVYTPAYAVPDRVVLETLWVRPSHGVYYFGDYYGPAYRQAGFESGLVYSRRHYDALVVYQSWEYRHEPRWYEKQQALQLARHTGKAPLPARTLTQQNAAASATDATSAPTPVLAPTQQVAASQGLRMAALNGATREQARVQARAVQASALEQRKKTEDPRMGMPLSGPVTTPLPQGVSKSHTVAGTPLPPAAVPPPGKGLASAGQPTQIGPARPAAYFVNDQMNDKRPMPVPATVTPATTNLQQRTPLRFQNPLAKPKEPTQPLGAAGPERKQ